MNSWSYLTSHVVLQHKIIIDVLINLTFKIIISQKTCDFDILQYFYINTFVDVACYFYIKCGISHLFDIFPL